MYILIAYIFLNVFIKCVEAGPLFLRPSANCPDFSLKFDTSLWCVS